MARKREKNLDLPPMMRRRRQRNGKIFFYYDTGKKPRHEIPLGSNYIEAVRKWADLYQPESGKFEKSKPTLRDAWHKYSTSELQTKVINTQRDYLQYSKKLLEFFEDAPLDEIEPQHISQFLRWRSGAPIRANREKALFSAIFNRCRSWGLTNNANPCMGVKGHKESGRSNYVDDEVFEFVMNNADTVLQNFLQLLYLTGQRPQDIFSMNLEHIQDSIIQIKQGKTGQKLRMNLKNDEGSLFEFGILVEKLLAYRIEVKTKHSYLLTSETGQEVTESAISQRFRHLRERLVAQLIAENQIDLAGRVAAYQMRDLRAKAGTDTTDSTGDIRTAQKQLGHKNLTMTEHYVKKRRGERVNPTR